MKKIIALMMILCFTVIPALAYAGDIEAIDAVLSVNGVAVQFGTDVSQINGFVDSTISSGGWYVELLHGIGAAGSSDNDYSSNYDTVVSHFKHIKEKSDAGKVWAGSFNEVVKPVCYCIFMLSFLPCTANAL